MRGWTFFAKSWAVGCVYAALLFGSPVLAGTTKVVVAEASYVMGDGDTLAGAEANVLLRAKRKAVEEAGVYLESLFVDIERTSGDKTARMNALEVRTISAAITETEILESYRTFEGDRPVFRVKIRAAVSLDKLEEAVKRLHSERQLAANYRELQRENSQLRAQLNELRKETQGVRTLLIEPAPKSQNRQRASELVQAAISAQNLSRKIDLATQAVSADDRFIDAYIVRGQIYLHIVSLAFSRKPKPDELSQYLERARADFDRALALDPNNTWALLGRGDTLTWYKNMEEAAKDYERVLEIDPLFDLARQRLITLYTTLARKQAAAKQWPQALATLDKLLGAAFGDSWLVYQKEAYLLRSEIYTKLKQPQRAIEDLSIVVRADPTDKDAFLRRAKLYQGLMLGRLAKDDFERACALGSTIACQQLP